MDNFNLIDLDKVLDEFEKTEEDPTTPVAPDLPSAAQTWPRGADKRSSPPPIARPLPVASHPSAVRPSSLRLPSALHLPDDQTSVSSSGYDSLRTSSEFILASQEQLLGSGLAVSAVPEEMTPTVEEASEYQSEQLPAVALDNCALRPDLVHASATPEVDLVAPVAFTEVEEVTIDDEEMEAYLALERREEPEGTEELPDVAQSCGGGEDEVEASGTPDIVDLEETQPDLLCPDAMSPGVDEPVSMSGTFPDQKVSAGDSTDQPVATSQVFSSHPTPVFLGMDPSGLKTLDFLNQSNSQFVSPPEYERGTEKSVSFSGHQSVSPSTVRKSLEDDSGISAGCLDQSVSETIDFIGTRKIISSVTGTSPTGVQFSQRVPSPTTEHLPVTSPDVRLSFPQNLERHSRTAIALSEEDDPVSHSGADPTDAQSFKDMADIESIPEYKPSDRPATLPIGFPSPCSEELSNSGMVSIAVNAAAVSPSGEKRMTASSTEGSGPKKKARPNSLLGLSRPTFQSEISPSSPAENPLYVRDDDESKAKRPTWLAIPTRSVSTDSGGGTSSSTLTPGPVMSEETVTPIAAEQEVEEEPAAVTGPEPTPFSADLGRVAPVWVHDRDAPVCMGCNVRFTLTRRRHHCRACGKVFCSLCCSHKSKMQFLEGKEARVCAVCFQHLIRLESSAARANDGQNVEEVSIPTSALRGSRRRSSVGRNVVFADGIRPGGDLSESDLSARVTTPSRPSAPNIDLPAFASRPADTGDEFCFLSGLAPDSFLPAVIVLCPELQLDLDPDIVDLAERLSNLEKGNAQRFAITRHLHVMVQRVSLSCCVGIESWAVCTRGLTTYGQAEVLVVLQALGDEILPPIDLFRLLHEIYIAAKKGECVSELSCFLTSTPFLGSKENAGCLFFRPTYQCLEQLPLPENTQFLVGVLIQRWEAPLAKLFPLRLLLRLGHQNRYYPCPIFSTRDRGPVYEGSGVTLLQLLVDFRNFSYTLPAIHGLRVHLSPGGYTRLLFPRSSYSTLMRTISSMDSQVLALGATFSAEADSHLVCVPSEVEENAFTTQAISIHDRSRQVTGASFVILNGGMRDCKSSIVEDGVMVQMSAQQLQECLSAMKAMRNFVLRCEEEGEDSQDEVHFQWTEKFPSPFLHCPTAPRLLSWVDGSPLDGPEVSHRRAPSSLRQVAENGEHRLLWASLFILQLSTSNENIEPLDPLQLGQEVARAVGQALHSHLLTLFSHSESSRALALRIRLTHDSLIDYEVGACDSDTRTWLRALCCPALDAHLVPLLSDRGGGEAAIELEFHVVE